MNKEGFKFSFLVESNVAVMDFKFFEVLFKVSYLLEERGRITETRKGTEKCREQRNKQALN
jgi:hypothetical protein